MQGRYWTGMHYMSRAPTSHVNFKRWFSKECSTSSTGISNATSVLLLIQSFSALIFKKHLANVLMVFFLLFFGCSLTGVLVVVRLMILILFLFSDSFTLLSGLRVKLFCSAKGSAHVPSTICFSAATGGVKRRRCVPSFPA